MIVVKLNRKNGSYTGFSVDGHSSLSTKGQDVLCAAVSSAVQLTVNGLCEVLGAQCETQVDEGFVSLNLKTINSKSDLLIESFSVHLKLLAEDYNEYLKITQVEV